MRPLAARIPFNAFELKLNYLLPAFFTLGAIVNLAITRAPALTLQGCADVAIRSSSLADYSQDPADLIFPPLDPAVIDEARNDSPGSSQDDPAAAVPTISQGKNEGAVIDMCIPRARTPIAYTWTLLKR